ncbi:Transposase domain [Burkholderia sp. b14]|nr:Transposase domain [Burkholderia sp. b14]
MRRAHGYTEAMFTMVKLNDFVPASHLLRPIRIWLNDALKRMEPVFVRMDESDAKGGHPSIAPQKLIRALLLQVLYSIRSECMLMEQISTTCCFAGLPALRWTIRCGTTLYGSVLEPFAHALMLQRRYDEAGM